jgi:hypothetical protein
LNEPAEKYDCRNAFIKQKGSQKIKEKKQEKREQIIKNRKVSFLKTIIKKKVEERRKGAKTK